MRFFTKVQNGYFYITKYAHVYNMGTIWAMEIDIIRMGHRPGLSGVI